MALPPREQRRKRWDDLSTCLFVKSKNRKIDFQDHIPFDRVVHDQFICLHRSRTAIFGNIKLNVLVGQYNK